MTEITKIMNHSSIIGENEVEYYPLNPLTSGDAIQFDVPESYTELTDSNFLLKVSAKITEADGTPLKDDARTATANLTLHALFRDVILKANGIIINQATGCYPYRAIIETNFTYSTAAKNGTVGIPQLYYKDKAGKFHSTAPSGNPGFDARVAKFAKSAEVDMAGRLHCDIFMQNKLIIPGVKFSLTLIPSSTQFHMLSGTANAAEKLVITKIVLKVRRLKLNATTILNIQKSLAVKHIEYPITHAVVRTAQISAGQTMLSNFVIHNGQIPRLVIISFVEATSFQGAYGRNPFNFTLRKCTSAQLSVNGILFPPLQYIPSKSWIEPYMASLRIARKLYSDSDTGITLDDFLDSGHQILPFDLTTYEAGIPMKTNGVVTLNAQWPLTAFDESYVMIFYILWDNIINIDSRGNVILDYIP
jgi:hypothetical protein